jgi:hypothetical protein
MLTDSSYRIAILQALSEGDLSHDDLFLAVRKQFPILNRLTFAKQLSDCLATWHVCTGHGNATHLYTLGREGYNSLRYHNAMRQAQQATEREPSDD